MAKARLWACIAGHDSLARNQPRAGAGCALGRGLRGSRAACDGLQRPALAKVTDMGAIAISRQESSPHLLASGPFARAMPRTRGHRGKALVHDDGQKARKGAAS